MRITVMRQCKQLFLKLLLVIELCLCGYIYVWGKNGLICIFYKQRENAALEYSVKILEDEIMNIECDIAAWQHDDFYKEKIAREQLQMARDGDEIFYIGHDMCKKEGAGR